VSADKRPQQAAAWQNAKASWNEITTAKLSAMK